MKFRIIQRGGKTENVYETDKESDANSGVFCLKRAGKSGKLKKDLKNLKKGVDLRRCIWYYSQAPYRKAHNESKVKTEPELDRTLKIKQRKELKEPVIYMRV